MSVVGMMAITLGLIVGPMMLRKTSGERPVGKYLFSGEHAFSHQIGDYKRKVVWLQDLLCKSKYSHFTLLYLALNA